MKRWKRRHGMLAGLVLIGLVALGGMALHAAPLPITSFEECADDGYPVISGNPSICTAHGKSYSDVVDISSGSSQAITSLDTEILVEGNSEGNYPVRQEVIRSQSAWESYWSRVHEAVHPTPNLLAVDFNNYDVVAISAGVQPTNGFTYEITSITQEGQTATVQIHELVPSINCNVQAVQTNPYFIMRVAKLPQNVVFSNDKSVHNCY
jgi:hypothetical protein